MYIKCKFLIPLFLVISFNMNLILRQFSAFEFISGLLIVQ